jgi:flagellar biosynthesis protein FliP
MASLALAVVRQAARLQHQPPTDIAKSIIIILFTVVRAPKMMQTTRICPREQSTI